MCPCVCVCVCACVCVCVCACVHACVHFNLAGKNNLLSSALILSGITKYYALQSAAFVFYEMGSDLHGLNSYTLSGKFCMASALPVSLRKVNCVILHWENILFHNIILF